MDEAFSESVAGYRSNTQDADSSRRRYARDLSRLALSVGEAKAIDYADFPPNLQTILDQRIATMNDAGGGVCIAGRVQFSDGVPINSGEDVQVNLEYGGDEPLRMYAGGWFVADRVLSSYYAGPIERSSTAHLHTIHWMR